MFNFPLSTLHQMWITTSGVDITINSMTHARPLRKLDYDRRGNETILLTQNFAQDRKRGLKCQTLHNITNTKLFYKFRWRTHVEPLRAEFHCTSLQPHSPINAGKVQRATKFHHRNLVYRCPTTWLIDVFECGKIFRSSNMCSNRLNWTSDYQRVGDESEREWIVLKRSNDHLAMAFKFLKNEQTFKFSYSFWRKYIFSNILH